MNNLSIELQTKINELEKKLNEVSETPIKLFPIIGKKPKLISFELIIDIISNITNTPIDLLLSKKRNGLLPTIRQLIVYFSYRYTGLTLYQIGRKLKRVDHGAAQKANITALNRLYVKEELFTSLKDTIEQEIFNNISN